MRKHFILTVCLILLFLQSLGLNVCASTTSIFETTNLSENEISQIWQNINVRNSLDSISLSSIGLPIVSFDVSENGMILLGFKGNKVAVVDEDTVTNFFEFSNDGSFYVQWNENNILLLLVRGSIIVELSSNGQFINMTKADENSIQNTYLWNQISKKNHLNNGEYFYCIKNKLGFLNIFSSSYSQLIKTDSNGNAIVIYDITKAQTTKTVCTIIVTILFFALVVLTIVLNIKRHRTQGRANK